MLTYADVCSRMLTYADVCWQEGGSKYTDIQHLRQAPPPPHLPSLLSPPSFVLFPPLFFPQFCGMQVSRGLVGVGNFGGVRLGLSYCAYTYISMLQHTSAYVSIRQHTSAYVSIRTED
jgi:hypothetical protein